MFDYMNGSLAAHAGHGNPRRVKWEKQSSLLYNMDTDMLTAHMSMEMRMKLVKHLLKCLRKEK